MKKLRLLLPVILAFVMALTIPFAAACKDPDGPGPGPGPEPEVTKTLQSISVDTSNAKVLYFVGESFSDDGLVVTASIQSSDKDTPDTVTVAKDYDVNSRAYDATQTGVYEIIVSYSLSGTVKLAKYSVQVVERQDGLYLELGGKDSVTINLDATTTSGSIDLAQLKVYDVDDYGNVTTTEIPSTDYALEVYKGTTKIENNALTNLSEGAYQIWVTKTSAIDSQFTLRSFLFVYVVDALESVEFASGTTTQAVGSTDKMSSTWTYKATFASGAIKTLTASDVTVEGVVTNAETTEGKATVTYILSNVKGEEQVKTCEVEYTIVAAGSQQEIKNEYKYELITGMTADKATLATSDFTGENSFLTVIGSVTYRSKTLDSAGKAPNCIEIKDDALKVNFQGTGTITIAFSSTSGSNESHFCLKDSKDNLIAAKNGTETEAGSKTYKVTGTTAVEITFEITEAGEYTLCSPSETTTRGCRLSKILMIDGIGGSGTDPVDEEFKHEYKYELITGMTADKATLATANFTGENDFLTVIGSVTYRSKTLDSAGKAPNCIEIKDDALKVNFQGTGTITIAFSSTSGSNESHFCLKDSKGNLIAAKNGTETEAGSKTYKVTGTTAVEITFEITEAGEYTLCSPSETTTRGCRLSKVVLQGVKG